MPDYTSILKRSISALPDASPQLREAVYQRARAALARQLTAVDPPLSPHEIEAQQQQLEDAVAAIEAEHAAEEPEFVSFEDEEEEAAPPPPPPPAPPRAAPPPPPEPEPQQPPRSAPPRPVQRQPQMPRAAEFGPPKPSAPPLPEPRDRQASAESEPRVVPAKPASQAQPQMRGERPGGEDFRRAPRQERPEPQDRRERADRPERPERQAPVRHEPQIVPMPAFEPEARDPEPYQEDVDRVPEFLEEDEARVSRARFDRGPRDPERPAGAAGYPDTDESDRGARRWPAIAALVAALVVLVGGGVLLYGQRDALMGLFGSDGETVQEAAVDTPPAAPAAEPDSGKRPDRLINGTVPSDVAEAETNGTGTDSEPAPAPAQPDAGTQAPAAPGTLPNVIPPSPSGNASESLVAQRAIFYEQGTEGAPGRATEGTIAWTQVQGQDGSPAIQANVEVPDRDLQAVITISKNADSSLPASHLVEVQLVGIDSLGSGIVERVPALVLKPNEQARGQPLAGAAVPVTDTLFWIALSDEPEQVTRNLTLLREGSWFDLPVLFEGGKRALLTFEKGIPGDKVFETVLSGWTGD